MSRERLRDCAYFTVTALGILLLGFLILRYLFIPTLPFLIAWGVAFALRPPSSFISKKLKLNRKFVAVTLAILFVALGISTVVAASILAMHKLWEFLVEFVSSNQMGEMLSGISDPVGLLLGERVEFNSHVADAVKEAVNRLISWLVDAVSSAVSSVPRFLLFLLVTVIAAVYFSLDLERINKSVKELLPVRVSEALVKAKNRLFSVGVKFVRSYLILMLVTFALMSVGLLVLRIRGAVLVAAIIALLDLLPIIGVGTLLVPWRVFQMIFGNLGTGIGIAVLLVLHEVVRQFLEPRFIGKSLGLHPIVSLMLLYIGYSVFGILGLIFLPIIGALIALLLKKKDSAEV